jgi:dTDP-4-amino-4,6-dideoxygalactose transaminase
MPVPFFDFARVLAPLQPALHDALQRCLTHGQFVLGPEVKQFETQLAAYSGHQHAVGLSSGTDALLAIFSALQLYAGPYAPLQPGDEVLTTPFTFISTATSVLRAGLRPVFADLAPGQFGPDVASLQAALTPKTRAVLVVHLFGEPLDLAPIQAFCAEHKLVLIEDCAQAIGAKFASGDHVGTAGLAGALSFFPAKNLGALGDGGACLTQDAELAKRVTEKRQHGCAVRYFHDHLGGNFRLDALHAAFLGVLLPQLDSWVAARQQHAQTYHDALQPLATAGRLVLPAMTQGHAWNQYVIRLPDRDAVQKRLQAAGIATAVYYPSALHQQGALADAHPPAQMPQAEAACREVLALPVYPGLTAGEQTEVLDHLLAALAG